MYFEHMLEEVQLMLHENSLAVQRADLLLRDVCAFLDRLLLLLGQSFS